MTYTIVWEEAALNAAARFLKDDADGLRQLMDAVDLLAISHARKAPSNTVRLTCAVCT